MRSALFLAFEGSFLRRRRLEGSSMRSALFFWLLRDRFCDVAIWRAVRCEVLFFLAFEGSFLRRRRWGGERQKK